jgi:hypothetical protein
MPEQATVGSPGFTERLRIGWQEARQCRRLIIDDPYLLILPSLSLALLAASWASLYLLSSFVAGDFALRMLVVGLAGLYPLAFVGTFFGVAFVAVADGRLRGRPTSIGEGLRVARGKAGAIARWSLLASGVGLILQVLQHVKADLLVGPVFSWIAGASWTVLTFFVVPVLAFEDLSLHDTLRRSGRVIGERWGEGIGGAGNMTAVVVAAVLVLSPAAVIAITIAFSVGQGIGIAAVVLVALVFMASIAALDAAAKLLALALYRFATAEVLVGGFTAAELSSAVRRKRNWRPRR